MKLLVDNFKVKATYKDGCFYDVNNKKIDEALIKEVYMSYQEFKEMLQEQQEKKTKKSKKDE